MNDFPGSLPDRLPDFGHLEIVPSKSFIGIVKDAPFIRKPYDMDILIISIINSIKVCLAFRSLLHRYRRGGRLRHTRQFTVRLFLHALIMEDNCQ